MRMIRILSAVLIFLLVLGLVSSSALAVPETPESGTELPAARSIRNRYLLRGGIGVGIVLVLYALSALWNRRGGYRTRRNPRRGRR